MGLGPICRSMIILIIWKINKLSYFLNLPLFSFTQINFKPVVPSCIVVYGLERSCTVVFGYVRSSTVRYGRVRSCTVRYGKVRSCTVRYGHVRSCTVWYGFDTPRYATLRWTLKKACGYSIKRYSDNFL